MVAASCKAVQLFLHLHLFMVVARANNSTSHNYLKARVALEHQSGRLNKVSLDMLLVPNKS